MLEPSELVLVYELYEYVKRVRQTSRIALRNISSANLCAFTSFNHLLFSTCTSQILSHRALPAYAEACRTLVRISALTTHRSIAWQAAAARGGAQITRAALLGGIRAAAAGAERVVQRWR